MKFGARTFGAVRKGSALFPNSERAERIIREFPFNKPVLLEARSARNPAHHDLFFAILDRVVAATGRFPNSDALNKALKFQLGLTDEWIDLDGVVHIEPGSIAWSAMRQEEFNEFFQAAMLIIAEYFYGDMPEAAIAEVEEMIAGELGKRAAHGGRVPDD